MKIYITNDNTELEGYIPFSPLRGNNIRVLDDDLVGDSECTEIFAPTILDYIPISCLVETLRNYVKKMRKGGKIMLGGVNLHLVCLMVARREINPIQANQIIFGNNIAHECKSGLSSPNDIAGILQELGLKIMSTSITGINYLVEGIRG